MGNRIVLSCEQIYRGIVKLNDSVGYHYYTVPFKEKVFFLPLRGFYNNFISGNVKEITFTVDHKEGNKWIMLSYTLYNELRREGEPETLSWKKQLLKRLQKGEL